MLTSEKPLCFFVQLGGYQTQRNRQRGILRYDVGVDANGYAPVSRDEILDFFRGIEPVQVGFAQDEAGVDA